jgi:thiol-disulfide isomerase/thioredoxin
VKFSALRSLQVGALLASAVCTAPVFADDPAPAPAPAAPEADATKPARDAWAAIAAARLAFKEAGKDAAKQAEARSAYAKATAEFPKAFVACDWNLFDPAKDAEILESGLQTVGLQALDDEDSKTALRAFEMLGAKFPARQADAFEGQSRAWLVAGDTKKAKDLLVQSVDKGDDVSKPGTQVSLGDLCAATGDLASAQNLWQLAIAAVPEGVDPRKDPRAAAKSGAEMRLALVGKPAPEVDSKTWIDGEAKPLSSMKGKVVLVDFWATWCPPCRQVMPKLNALYEKHKGDGLLVLGVTRYDGGPGFLPTAGTKDPLNDGVRVPKIAPEEHIDHLKQFKANVGITYPFVVATEAEPKAYHVSGIPTLAVIDREGSIEFLAVGSGNEALLKVAVEHALGASAGPAPVK